MAQNGLMAPAAVGAYFLRRHFCKGIFCEGIFCEGIFCKGTRQAEMLAKKACLIADFIILYLCIRKGRGKYGE